MKQHHLPTRLLWYASLAVILLAFAVRLQNLSGDSFWFDEVLTMRVIEGGQAKIFSQSDHPPLFYLLTALASHLFGANEFAVRLLSLIAGTISIPLLITLGHQMGYLETGLWAALLLALSPFHIQFSQEARHYALLMTISLATFLLLHRALRQPTGKSWLAYGLLTLVNIYIHYSAFIVLAAQSLIIVLWFIVQLRQRQYRHGLYPLATALIIVFGYLPWLSRLQLVFTRNVNADVSLNNRQIVPLSIWIGNIFRAFNTTYGLLPYILFSLCLIGLYFLWRRRTWLNVSFIIAGLILPLPLVKLFNVVRGAYPRYLIYMLPFYLLLIALAIVGLLRWLRKYQWRGTAVSLLPALALLIVYTPLISYEHHRIREDWRGVYQQIEQSAAVQDIILPLSLTYADGFNVTDSSLFYYLQRENGNYVYLHGNYLTVDTVAELVGAETNVWSVVHSERPISFNNPALAIIPFSNNIYLVHQAAPIGDALAQAIDLYQQIIPLAQPPSPACIIKQDLVALQIAAQNYETAETLLADITTQCPTPAIDHRPDLQAAIHAGLINQYQQAGETELAWQRAAQLWRIDRKNEVALGALTFANLWQWYSDGQATIQQDGVPEPSRVDRFVMPHNGDWDDVIFAHPPTTISYQLTLPDHPVALYFRIAMAPPSWEWGGDGATFIVNLQPDGRPTIELFRQYISNDMADRDWHEAQISLADYRKQPVMLTLTTNVGPNGNNTGDWAGWGTPRLLWLVADS